LLRNSAATVEELDLARELLGAPARRPLVEERGRELGDALLADGIVRGAARQQEMESHGRERVVLGHEHRETVREDALRHLRHRDGRRGRTDRRRRRRVRAEERRAMRAAGERRDARQRDDTPETELHARHRVTPTP
jgi:hypothetical protein